MKTVLFLGYDRNQTRLIQAIQERGFDVQHRADPIHSLSEFDLVISFGYRHILKAETITTARRPVINLHISYLPWNRGAHPLFWAMYDNTPVGVTVHEIDTGIDTGPVCVQRLVAIDAAHETFASAHRKLVDEIQTLFIDNMDDLLNGNYTPKPQPIDGTHRRVRDLPEGFEWAELIGPAIARLKEAGSV